MKKSALQKIESHEKLCRIMQKQTFEQIKEMQDRIKRLEYWIVGGMGAEGHIQVINAEIPLPNLHDYATALKSMSSGRGMFSQEFSHYEDMPHNEAEKVKSDYQAARAAGNEE